MLWNHLVKCRCSSGLLTFKTFVINDNLCWWWPCLKCLFKLGTWTKRKKKTSLSPQMRNDFNDFDVTSWFCYQVSEALIRNPLAFRRGGTFLWLSTDERGLGCRLCSNAHGLCVCSVFLSAIPHPQNSWNWVSLVIPPPPRPPHPLPVPAHAFFRFYFLFFLFRVRVKSGVACVFHHRNRHNRPS